MVRANEKFLEQITLLAKDGAETVSASDARIISLTDPIDLQDAVTKSYVDSLSYLGQVQEEIEVTEFGQVSFILSNTPVSDGYVMMFVNGVKQLYGEEYSNVGDVVTYSGTVPLETSFKVEFWYLFNASGSGPSSIQALRGTLSAGNTSDGYDIDLTLGSSIISSDGYVSLEGTSIIYGGLVLSEVSSKPFDQGIDEGLLWVHSDGYLVFTNKDDLDVVIGEPGIENVNATAGGLTSPETITSDLTDSTITIDLPNIKIDTDANVLIGQGVLANNDQGYTNTVIIGHDALAADNNGVFAPSGGVYIGSGVASLGVKAKSTSDVILGLNAGINWGNFAGGSPQVTGNLIAIGFSAGSSATGDGGGGLIAIGNSAGGTSTTGGPICIGNNTAVANTGGGATDGGIVLGHTISSVAGAANITIDAATGHGPYDDATDDIDGLTHIGNAFDARTHAVAFGLDLGENATQAALLTSQATALANQIPLGSYRTNDTDAIFRLDTTQDAINGAEVQFFTGDRDPNANVTGTFGSVYYQGGATNGIWQNSDGSMAWEQLGSGGGGGIGPNTMTAVSTTQTTQLTGWTTLSAFEFDPFDYDGYSSIEFRALIQTTDVADSAEVRIFNVDTASVVGSSTLSTSSISAVLVSADITNEIDVESSFYEVQLRLATTGAPNSAICKRAEIRVE